MELRRRVLMGRIVGRPEVQLLLRPVVHLAHLRRHDALEDGVAGVQHAGAGAEVLAQQHLAGLAVLRLCGRRIGVVFPQEDGGVGQTEAVNALLHVAHGEQVLLLPGDGGENAVLHIVGVLIFVHHDLPVAARHLPRQLRRLSLRQQQLNGIVLLIREVHGVAPHLLRLIAAGEFRRQVGQRQHGGRHHGHIRQQLVLRCLEWHRQLLQRVLAGLQQRLNPLLLRVLAPHRTHAAEGGPDGRHGGPVAPCRGKLPQL